MAGQTRENGSTPAELHLPASIQAAWGVAGRVTKGPRPALSVERIVAAAMEVADAEGLAAVSMSRVAKQLGTAPMSLYRYIGAKTELLDLMLDAAYGAPPEPTGALDWRSGLTLWAATSLGRLYAHPWGVRIPISGPPITPNQVRWMEFGLHTLAGTGLSPTEKMSTILLVSGYVRNWVTLTTDLGNDAAAVTEAMRHYASDLKVLVDREHFPELREVIASGILSDEDLDDNDYAFGLERILDGIGVLVRSRS